MNNNQEIVELIRRRSDPALKQRWLDRLTKRVNTLEHNIESFKFEKKSVLDLINQIENL